MAEWKKICCAIDFSEPSRFAMGKAADLARRLGAELTLLHVNEAMSLASSEMGLAPGELLERAAKETAPKIDHWRAEAERLAGRPVVSKVLAGDAAGELLRSVREGSFDLLVMATHGRSGLTRLVLGSVAETVVRRAGVPVLVIRS